MRLTPLKQFTPKIEIPDGFYLIQDTREQKPLFKSFPWVVEKALKAGDYSIQGFETVVAIERKSVNDLYGSLGQGRKRFEREMQRLMEYRYKALLIEGTESQLYQETHRFSALHPNSIYHSLAKIEVFYGLCIYYASKPKWARWWTLSRLVKLFKYLREGE